MITVPLSLDIDENSDLWQALRPHAGSGPQRLFKNAALLYAQLLERATALGVGEVESELGFDAFCVNVLDAVDDYIVRLEAETRNSHNDEPDITLSEVEEAAFLGYCRDPKT